MLASTVQKSESDIHISGLTRGLVVKNPPAKAGDMGSIPGWVRSPGGGNGNSLQYSCLENSMNKGVWWATDHGVSKSQIRLSDSA